MSEQIIIDKLSQTKVLIFNNKAQELINSLKNKDIVMFLGNTRSGKSTVVNHILGTQLKAYKIRNNVYNIVKEDPSSTGPDIGTKSVSETSVPSAWISSKINSVVVDAPGFQDNRGEVQDIANSFYIKEILSNVNSAKFVIISDINEILNDNINSFINLIDNVHTMLPLEEKLNPGVVMVFNKDKEDYTKEEIISVIKEKILLQLDIEIANRPLIEYLTRNPNQIEIIHMPKQEGKIDDEHVFGNLIVCIESNATKLSKDILKSVSPGISYKSRNFLLEARKYLTEMHDFNRILNDALYNFDNVNLMEFNYFNDNLSSSQVSQMIYRLRVIENSVKSLKNPQWSIKETLQRMSAVVCSSKELKDGSSIHINLDFIKFIDGILKLTESNVFKIKIEQTIDQMLNKINEYIRSLNNKKSTIENEEARQKMLKEQAERIAELSRELERERQRQEEIKRSEKKRCTIL